MQKQTNKQYDENLSKEGIGLDFYQDNKPLLLETKVFFKNNTTLSEKLTQHYDSNTQFEIYKSFLDLWLERCDSNQPDYSIIKVMVTEGPFVTVFFPNGTVLANGTISSRKRM